MVLPLIVSAMRVHEMCNPTHVCARQVIPQPTDDWRADERRRRVPQRRGKQAPLDNPTSDQSSPSRLDAERIAFSVRSSWN